MSFFDNWRKKQTPQAVPEGLLRTLREQYAAAGLPHDNESLIRTLAETPLYAYQCPECGFYLHLGGPAPGDVCGKCGRILTLLLSPPKVPTSNDGQAGLTDSRVTRAEFHFQRGLHCFQQNDLEGALAELTRAIEANPKYADAYYNRSEVYIAKGNFDRAIADCDTAIQLNPNDADALVNRSSARGQKGDFKLAIADASAAIKINPNHPIAYLNRGLSREEEGDVGDALEDFRRFVALAPSDPRAKILRMRMGL